MLALLWLCAVSVLQRTIRRRRMKTEEDGGGRRLTCQCDESICSRGSLAAAAADPDAEERGAGRSAAGRKRRGKCSELGHFIKTFRGLTSKNPPN